MPTRPPSCPKCSVTMKEGWTLDNTYGGRAISSWVEGPPQKSVWVGVKLGKAKPLEVSTYRCPSCGFLESYAK